MCVAYSRPNGWTEWTEFFCGHSGVPSGVLKTKKRFLFVFKKKISRATPGPSASKNIKLSVIDYRIPLNGF